MIQEQFFSLVNGATSAGARVYPSLAPDGVNRPFIVYTRVSALSENVLSQAPGLVNTHLQVDVYASTYSDAQSAAAQVIALMQGWSIQNILSLALDEFEGETKLHRVILDFSIWHS
jgi:hypothetical protein